MRPHRAQIAPVAAHVRHALQACLPLKLEQKNVVVVNQAGFPDLVQFLVNRVHWMERFLCRMERHVCLVQTDFHLQQGEANVPCVNKENLRTLSLLVRVFASPVPALTQCKCSLDAEQ